MAEVLAALTSTLLVALAVVQPVSRPGPWARLHRPLHLPTVAQGAPCPVSGVGRINFAKYGVGKGIGPGPAYPIGFRAAGLSPAVHLSLRSSRCVRGQRLERPESALVRRPALPGTGAN